MFYVLVGDNHHKYLKDFHVVYSTMRYSPFPWMEQQKTSCTCNQYLLIYGFFLTSRTTSTRKEICDIRKQSGETLYEYWERFNKLCVACPHHQISGKLLIQYFYERLMLMNRSMIDAASGGALRDKKPIVTRNLIFNMAINTKQFGLLIGQHYTSPLVRVCGICAFVEHSTDASPTLQETNSSAEVARMIIGQQYVVPLPFPNRTIHVRKSNMDDNMLQTFRKVEINIHFLKYANFLKKLWTHKRKKLKGDVDMGMNDFALIKSDQVSSLLA
ncbi:hypothetical protein CR513_45393, partial [Mucuna pruriens]